MSLLADVAWNPAHGAELVAALACAAKMRVRVADGTAGRPLPEIGAKAGVEIEPVDCAYPEVNDTLGRMAPGVVLVAEGYVAITGARGDRLTVLAPDLRARSLPRSVVHDALCGDLEAAPSRRIERWLTRAGVSPRRQARARRRILERLLGAATVRGMWVLREAASTPLAAQLLGVRAPARLALFVALGASQLACSVLAWILVGRGALEGQADPGWLVAWALATITLVPLAALSQQTAGGLSIAFASRLKQRLLVGALRLDPASIRARGSGELLAMVDESEALEASTLSGALGGFTALVQLASAIAILSLGVGGALMPVLLGSWSVAVLALAAVGARRRAVWTRARHDLAGDFVENVVGHRTRTAQQEARHHHVREDGKLEAYSRTALRMNAVDHLLATIPARAWILLAFVALAPLLLRVDLTASALVVTLAGILQAQAALGGLVAGASSVANALVAWRSLQPLFVAAAHEEPVGSVADAPPREVALDVRRATFAYPGSGKEALVDVSLSIRRGERLLVEGPSGGGKSTLAMLLGGAREPTRGLVLGRGFDRRTLGADAWRRVVAVAPQFHENHVLSGTLAYNLLMGRAWPATDADRREAEIVCRRLGLGALLERMPAGLDQFVGETGWQLSHGERSRVFLARALLQNADLVVLDESFGAVDPVTLDLCVDTVLELAPALAVIAHP